MLNSHLMTQTINKIYSVQNNFCVHYLCLPSKMQAEFSLTSKNKRMLIVDGFEFYLKRENVNSTNWNCSKYQSLKCRTIAVTRGTELVEIRGDHNHDAKLAPAQKRQIVAEIKKNSEKFTPAVAIADALEPVSLNFAVQLELPSKHNLIRTSERVRQRKDVGENPIPSDRHFDIPQEFADFILHDTGKEDSERIIVFGDRFMLTELETSKFWLADGTFKLSPTLFYQIYTIHASVMETTPACVYAFLPNKTEKTSLLSGHNLKTCSKFGA